MCFTYFIYFTHKKNKINIIALGDGIASGETSFLIDGISFNDYLKDYYTNQKLLKKYNNSFAYKNNTINDLIQNINSNVKTNGKFIKQIINKANIITLCIGEEELIKLSITNDLDINYIMKMIEKYDLLLHLLRENTDGNIMVISFYENIYLDKSKVIILNSELKNLSGKYNAIFINIDDLLITKEFFPDKNSYYFNYKAHMKIADMIIHSV